MFSEASYGANFRWHLLPVKTKKKQCGSSAVEQRLQHSAKEFDETMCSGWILEPLSRMVTLQDKGFPTSAETSAVVKTDHASMMCWRGCNFEGSRTSGQIPFPQTENFRVSYLVRTGHLLSFIKGRGYATHQLILVILSFPDAVFSLWHCVVCSRVTLRLVLF